MQHIGLNFIKWDGSLRYIYVKLRTGKATSPMLLNSNRAANYTIEHIIIHKPDKFWEYWIFTVDLDRIRVKKHFALRKNVLPSKDGELLNISLVLNRSQDKLIVQELMADEITYEGGRRTIEMYDFN